MVRAKLEHDRAVGKVRGFFVRPNDEMWYEIAQTQQAIRQVVRAEYAMRLELRFRELGKRKLNR